MKTSPKHIKPQILSWKALVFIFVLCYSFSLRIKLLFTLGRILSYVFSENLSQKETGIEITKKRLILKSKTLTESYHWTEHSTLSQDASVLFIYATMVETEMMNAT
jgi:hypothetical protein